MKETAKRNAEALLKTSQDKKDYEVIKDEASFLLDTLTKQHNVLKEVDGLLSEEQKKAITDYESSLDDRKYLDIKGFLDVIIESCNEELNVEKVKVYAARNMLREDKEILVNALKKKLNKEIELDIIIDESLIGGYKICFQDKVYDLTLKNKIEQMKFDLLNEGR